MDELTRGVFITGPDMQGDTPGSVRTTLQMANLLRAVFAQMAPQWARDLKKGNPDITEAEVQKIVNSYQVTVQKVRL